MGGIYAVLPAGCISPTVHGSTYYLCGNTWFQPAYGANGFPTASCPLLEPPSSVNSLHSRSATFGDTLELNWRS